MKRILIFLSLACTTALAQTKAVNKTISNNALTESLVVPSGKTLTIASGATIAAAAGSTITGFTASAAWADITGKPTTLSGYGITDAAPLASPTFTGTVTIPSGASISGYLTSASASSTYAPLASPTFTGTITSNGTGGAITTLNATGMSVLRAGSTAGNQLTFPARDGSLRTYNLPDINTANITLLDTATAASTYLTATAAASTYLTATAAASTYQTNLGEGSVTDSMLAGSIALSKLTQTSATSGQVIAWNGTAWAPTTLSSASLSGANTWTALNKFTNGIWTHRGNDNGVVIGYQAAESATAAASDCVAIGFAAIGAPATTPTQGVGIGRHAGYAAGGGNYFIAGHAAGQYAYSASNAVIIGYLAARNPTQNASAFHFSSVIIGHEACMSNASAQTGTVIGAQAGRNATNTVGAVIAGYAAGQSATTSTNAVMVGNYAGQSAAAASNAIFIGNEAGRSQTSGTSLLIIDSNASTATSSTTAFISGNMATGTRSLNFNASTLTLGVSGGQVILNTPAAPATSSSTGTPGQIRWDADYIYICIATNTWRRIAHSTW